MLWHDTATHGQTKIKFLGIIFSLLVSLIQVFPFNLKNKLSIKTNQKNNYVAITVNTRTNHNLSIALNVSINRQNIC